MTEADWQSTVIDLLKVYRYKVCEFRKARVKRDGEDVYRTPFGADGKGMTDLIAARPGRVLFIENKSDTGTLSQEQKEWQDILCQCPGVEYYISRPKDFDRLKAIWR
jgi:hypothetical protein